MGQQISVKLADSALVVRCPGGGGVCQQGSTELSPGHKRRLKHAYCSIICCNIYCSPGFTPEGTREIVECSAASGRARRAVVQLDLSGTTTRTINRDNGTTLARDVFPSGDELVIVF